MFLNTLDVSRSNCRIENYHDETTLQLSSTTKDDLQQMSNNVKLDKDIILFPIHFTKHFYLFVAELKNKKLIIINSERGFEN